MFLTDGGLETTLIFHEEIELPHFAALVLLRNEQGREALTRYFRRYLAIAEARGLGFIMDTATWRANPDWAAKLDIGPEELDQLNRDAVAFCIALGDGFERETGLPCVVNGVIGPRGDGYRIGDAMNATQARQYHGLQIASLARAGADMVSAMTMNYVEEAIGVTLAARDHEVPVVISFTVETDGKLPSGASIAEAIEAVDGVTGAHPVYYMINCAHPSHFADALHADSRWLKRIRGIRANASTKSHAELDEAVTLDAGDPEDLGRRYRELRNGLTELNVVGGCCGTDHRHMAAIADAILPTA